MGTPHASAFPDQMSNVQNSASRGGECATVRARGRSLGKRSEGRSPTAICAIGASATNEWSVAALDAVGGACRVFATAQHGIAAQHPSEMTICRWLDWKQHDDAGALIVVAMSDTIRATASVNCFVIA